jgi:hypothetical protein
MTLRRERRSSKEAGFYQVFSARASARKSMFARIFSPMFGTAALCGRSRRISTGALAASDPSAG